MSLAVTYFIRKPRPWGKNASIQQYGDALCMLPLHASTSGGTASSPLSLELCRMSLNSPVSTPMSGVTLTILYYQPSAPLKPSQHRMVNYH